MYGDKGEVPEEEYIIPLGKAEVKKTGTDVTIVSFGKMIPRVVNPAIEEDNYDCPFYFEVTVDGIDYYTPCYMSIIDATCRMRDTIWIESDFLGFDCLGRWYGAPTPQSLIAGNNSLSFNNGMLFWGTQSVLPTEYEFTNFDTCIVTKTFRKEPTS